MSVSTEANLGNANEATMVSRVRHCVFALLCIAAVLAGVTHAGYRFDMDIVPLQKMMTKSSHSPAIPLAESDWQEIELPGRSCSVSWSACYDHYKLFVPSTAEQQGVFLPEFAGSVQISVNSIPIATYGNLNPPVERVLFQPAFVRVPEHLHQQQGDEIVVTVGSDRRNFNRLSPIFVGDADELEPIWRISHWLAVDLLVASTGIYVVLGFLALLTYRMARESTLFIWFGCIVLCAAARNSFFLWTNPDYDLLRGLIYFQASLGQLAAIVGFTGTLVGVGKNRFYVWLSLGSVVLVTLFAWQIIQDAYVGAFVANVSTRVIALVVSAWTLWVMTRYLLADWHFVKPWVFALFFGAFLLMLHDIGPAFFNMPIRHQLSNLAPLLVVVAFCFILAQQFSQALQRVRAHNADLTAAVQRREQALHSAYEDIRLAEQEQAVNTERVRILQDVHDGVGGRLAGLVMLARRHGDAEMARHLEESLADLRLIIDSVDDELTDDLACALNVFRQRADSLLVNQGITPAWQVECPAGLSVSPSWMVALFRTLQEVLHNIVRHAAAKGVSVKVAAANDNIVVQIADDGIGIADINAARQQGRGLGNLQQRLTHFGGTLSISSDPNGTHVDITLPLQKSEGPQESGGSSRA